METNSSPSAVQRSLCGGCASSALLKLKQSLLIERFASAYPKAEMWHSEGEGSDCCSWNRVDCDIKLCDWPRPL